MRATEKWPQIRANGVNGNSGSSGDGPKNVAMIAAVAIPRGEVSAEGNAQPRTRRFDIVASTGEPFRQWWSSAPFVMDFAGMEMSQTMPVLYAHDSHVESVVGQSDQVTVEGGNLRVRGPFMGDSPFRQQIIKLADEGFVWQASIGADPLKIERVEADAMVTVNGRQYKGPLNVVRRSRLSEVSFVVRGADHKTSAVVASHQSGGIAMETFEQWIAALGLDAATLSAEARQRLQAKYDAETKRTNPVPAPSPANPPNSPPPVPSEAEIAARYRNVFAAESARVDAIRTICAGNPNLRVSVPAADGRAAYQMSLEARAIEQGWDAQRTELEVLRASRSNPAPFGFVRAGEPSLTNRVIEAAIAQSGRLANVGQVFTDQELQAAHTRFPRGISLQQILLEAAWHNGFAGRTFRGHESTVLRAAFAQPAMAGQYGIAAEFSTFSLPGILSNNMNKFLLMGYTHVEQAWRAISSIRSVSDFKTVTSYRMTGAFQYQEVAPTGELKHGSTSELSFTNQAKTYGLMYAITRTDIINDDLGALTDVPRLIGRGAALKLNAVFWAAFIANSNFFKTGNANYISGSTTNLQSSSLATGLKTFRDQTDADGKPMAIEPRILLVPTALEATALELMQSTNYNTGGAATDTKVPNKNIWAGRFNTVVSAYLTDSATAWYLLADPLDIPVIETAFLNGAEAPTVETSEAEFNTLGIQMRGYHDFGVSLQDYRGGVKSKGAS